MANAHTHQPQPRKPRRVHAPSQRAAGLDPEFTAQPHALSDDIDLSVDEAGSSIAPEDLASHFLSEAVEQGDFVPRDAAELELKLSVEESASANVEIELGAWSAEAPAADSGKLEELANARHRRSGQRSP